VDLASQPPPPRHSGTRDRPQRQVGLECPTDRPKEVAPFLEDRSVGVLLILPVGFREPP
jgi:hypothetical protein